MDKKPLRTVKIPSFTVRLVKDGVIEVPANVTRVTTSRHAYEVLAPYFAGLDREHFAVIGLNVHNAVIGFNTVSIGTLDSTVAQPREIFSALLRIPGVKTWYAAHNHPGGTIQPSPPDVYLTKQLVWSGRIFGLPMRDHLVIVENNYFSFRDAGILVKYEDEFDHASLPGSLDQKTKTEVLVGIPEITILKG